MAHPYGEGRETKRSVDTDGSVSSSRLPMVTGLFSDWEKAERVYAALASRGYKPEDINVVMSDETRRKYFSSEIPVPGARTQPESKAAMGAGIGGTIGGATGAIAAALAAAGASLALPGILVIAGPLAAAFAGAGVGGITGGLIGALISSGLPEERVKHYEQEIANGGILIAVYPHSEEDARYFEREWRDSGAVDVHR